MTDNKEVRQSLLDEFESYFPEIKGCQIKYEYFQCQITCSGDADGSGHNFGYVRSE
jgi:hypothetical protein